MQNQCIPNTASKHVRKFLLASVGNALERFRKPKPPALSDHSWYDGLTCRSLTGLIIRAIRSRSLQDGSHVGHYILDMMDDFARLKSLGGVIDPVSQMVMILDGLPASFESVRMEMLLSLEPLSIPEIWLKLKEAQESMKKTKEEPLVDVAENTTPIGQKLSMGESSQKAKIQPREVSKRIAKRKAM